MLMHRPPGLENMDRRAYRRILATRTLHPIRRGSGSSPNLFFSVEVDKLVRKLAKEAGAI